MENGLAIWRRFISCKKRSHPFRWETLFLGKLFLYGAEDAI